MNLIYLAYIFSGIFILQYVLVMLIGLKYAGKLKSQGGSIKEVSIIIPFRNEQNRIPGLLEDITQLKVPNGLKYEFVFVDDHSNDDTRNLISTLKLDNLIVLSNGESGKKAAIRAGVKYAQYEWVLTWDADIRVKKNYLNSLSCL